jgi:hypothetical protein
LKRGLPPNEASPRSHAHTYSSRVISIIPRFFPRPGLDGRKHIADHLPVAVGHADHRIVSM